MTFQIRDRVGEVFGRLTVVAQHGWYVSPAGHRRVMWRCRCVCGNEKVASSSSLTTKNTTSCGCLHREKVAYADPQTATWKSILRNYRRSAAARGLRWELENSFAIDLMKKACTYCGACHSNRANSYLTKTGRLKENSVSEGRSARATVFYNGIDRIDNTIGYVVSNCVTSCKNCNYAKHNLSPDEFAAWLAGVASKQQEAK